MLELVSVDSKLALWVSTSRWNLCCLRGQVVASCDQDCRGGC